LNRFGFSPSVVALKHAKFPGQNHVKCFFTLHPVGFSVDDFAFLKIYQPSICSTSHLHAAAIATYADKLNDIRKARVGYCASEPCGFHLRLPFLLMSVCNSDVQISLYFCTIAIFQHEINKFRTG
jgi:hypothetical protein